jgi:hypothetical protein
MAFSDELIKSSKRAQRLITEMKNKGQCERCIQEVIDKIYEVRDAHNLDAECRQKEYRCYKFDEEK